MGKNDKAFYWISTILFSAFMLSVVWLYVTDYELLVGAFTFLGFPIFLIYPLAAAKFLGVLAILTRKCAWCTDWAYKGFIYLLVLAIMTHYYTNSSPDKAIIALVLVSISYFYEKKVFK